MSSIKAKYRLYRLMLHVYPKSFRREYGEQMVQTLDDMLNHSESSTDRLAVWVRALAETPFNALRENINSLEENGMNKLTRISNKKLAIVAIVVTVPILLILMFAYKSEAVVRWVSNQVYGRSLNGMVAEQNEKLADPFTVLMSQSPKPKSDCYVGPSDGLRMHVLCDSSVRAYIKLGQSTEDKAKVMDAVQTVTAALKTEGYEAGSNGMTLERLVSGTYEGKDYSPDAFYQKVIDGKTCTFDTMIAYANPAQPAITMWLNCTKEFDFLGRQTDKAFGPYQGM